MILRRWVAAASAALGVLLIAGGLVVGGIAAPRATAVTLPPTLTSEFFSGSPVDLVTATCNPSGTSTISYFTTGVAVGPYPGTYTESGTVTVGPETLPIFVNGFQFGPLATLDAFFTIDSAVGQVTGTKHLAVVGSTRGACYDFTDRALPGGSPVITGIFRQVCACFGAFPINYEATIEAATGVFGDTGTSDLLLNHFEATVQGGGTLSESSFNEAFRSSGTTVPLVSAGQVTGGGKVGSDVTFGLTAKSNDKGVKGECTVVDRATDTKVKCLDATTLFQTATHTTITGSADVNGVPTTYRIDVDDLAEPGRGVDTFTIRTANGYAAGGTLTQGNIQLH